MELSTVEENSFTVDEDGAVVPCLVEVSGGSVDPCHFRHTTIS